MALRGLVDVAAALLQAVMRLDQPADRVVASFFQAHRALGARERRALAETAYELLRRRPLLTHLAQSGRGPLTRRLVLLAWRGEESMLLRHLGGEEAAWRAQALAIDAAAMPEAMRHHLPEWLAPLLREQVPPAEFWALAAALGDIAPLDLRVNTLKSDRTAAAQALALEGITAAPTPHSPWALRVQGKPALQRSQVFARGEVEVQDEGSQLLALLTGASRGEMVVDFCAGAGGKTLALGAMMRGTGRLYAFDTSAARLAALQPRLARSGLPNVHPAAIANERDERVQRLHGKIDRVLVDAPCSGLGTLRRNPDLKWRHTPDAIQAMATRQSVILEAASRLLRPGGRLVYATCSLLPCENEAVAQGFTRGQAARFEPLSAAVLLQQAGVGHATALAPGPHLRLWPHRHGTDGFFAAVWQRT